jgi:hypothetical protein
VCSALRLARFNVALDQSNVPAWKSNYFVGVPAPAGAITLLLPIYAQSLGLHLPSLTPLVFHDFSGTPEPAAMRATFDEAERAGADIAKLAAMPRDLDDVLALLGATCEARRRQSIPIITMSMGAYGALSRMVGGVFGSALTFAVGQSSSAPGQLPIEDLHTVLAIVRRSMGA